MDIRSNALLVLENGSVYNGYSFGHKGNQTGEICFNTSMSGYQEIITDPSYFGQIVTLTYPMIGNYGINSSANESAGIQASALVVKEYVQNPSNFTSVQSLGDFLKEESIPGIEGIDTRKLVLEIRNQGAMRAGVFFAERFDPVFLEEIRSIPSMKGRDLASLVTTKSYYQFSEKPIEKKFRVAVFDFGVKRNILRMLDSAGFEVHVFPASVKLSDIKEKGIDCYFLSNGPGDPEPLRYAIESAKGILQEGKPVFGICLGHQILALAEGAKSYKLKFGHRGGNQPVMDKESAKVEITSQNHGFAIEDDLPPGGSMEITHVNLNDGTVEGFVDRKKNMICVQYHPEASPGPHDSAHLFHDFYRMVDDFYKK